MRASAGFDANRDWGEAPWDVAWREPAPALPKTADIAVIGGGLTGVAAALALARAGRDVVLLEAGRLGSGASGRTGGLVLDDTATGAVEGFDGALEALSELVERERIDCALSRPGCLELAHEEDDELPPAWPDGDQFLCARELVAGGSVDPGRLLTGLARAATEAGARLCQNATVAAIDARPGGLRLRLSGGARLDASRAVLALNAFAETLLPRRDPVRPALTLAVRTAPLPRPLDATALPFYTVDQPYLWGRPNEDGSWVFGSGIVVPASNDPRDVRLSDREAAAALRRLERRVHGLDPRLAEVEILYRWGGPVAFTATRRPVLETHDTLPLVCAGGYAGHGVALACHVGALAAEAARAL